MSVNQNIYVIWGVRLNYDDFYTLLKNKYNLTTDEVYDQIIEEYRDSAFEGIKHKNKLCVIMDGMCGKYVIIGYVIAKSDENQQGLEEVIAIQALPSKLKKQIKTNLREIFDIEENPQWLIVNHYR